MKPVLLEWGKKPEDKEKHAPLLCLDPETRQPVKYGKPHSEADFNGEEAIKEVMGDNNLLVKASTYWEVALGSAYEEFLKVGLRWAQQLDGRFTGQLRERTLQQFTALYQGLGTSLLEGVLTARKQRRDAGLESLLEQTDGMLPDDAARLSGYVAKLKQRPVPAHASSPSSRSVQKRLEKIRWDRAMDDDFVQNCRLVPAELRADYVGTVEVAELKGSRMYSLHERSEDVRKWVSELGIGSGRLYLEVLHTGIAHFGEKYDEAHEEVEAANKQLNTAGTREERLKASDRLGIAGQKAYRANTHSPDEFYDALDRSLRPLSGEKRSLYLNFMSTTQQADLWLYPDVVRDIMDEVGGKVGSENVTAVLHSAVNALKTGQGEFFKVIEKNGMPDVRSFVARA